MRRKNIFIMIYLILFVTIIFLPIRFALAAPETEENGENYNLNAIISDSSEYTNPVSLTTEGIDISNWKYNTSKYLQINPQILDDDYTYAVTIELPKELYVVGTEIELPSGFSDVEFTKNENIDVNNGQVYEVKPFSGKLEYTLDTTVTSATIQLELKYDEVLWDKQENSIITQEGIKPITIKLLRMESDNNITVIKEVSVKKATADIGQNIQPNIYYLQSDTTEVLNQPVILSQDIAPRLKVLFSTELDNISWYYDKLVIKVELPYYEDESGNKNYLEIDTTKLNLIAFSDPEYIVDTATEGISTITINKPYFSSGEFVQIYFKTLKDELLDSNQTQYIFSKGKIEAFADSITQNKNIKIYSKDVENITIQTNTYEDVNFLNDFMYTEIAKNKPDEVVARLGGFYLRNTGTKKSCLKQVIQEFDIKNTNDIKVTNINLSTDRIQEFVNIEYTLVDEDGNQVYFDDKGNVVTNINDNVNSSWNISIKNDNYNETGTHKTVSLSRKQLIESHRNYFFKTIKYELKEIRANDNLFSVDAQTGSGNFYGYIQFDENSYSDIQSKMTILSPNNEEIDDISTTAIIYLTEKLKFGAFFNNLSISENAIVAGESFRLQGELEVLPYPYGSATWLKDIVIGLVLPNGISLNEQGVKIEPINNQEITDLVIDTKDLGNNNTLWTIKYPSSTYIGYYDETLSYLEGRKSTKFNIQIDTDAALNSTSVQLNNILYAAGINQTNVADGQYSYTKAIDTYDLNENNIMDDDIIGINLADTINCQIIAKSEILDIKSSVILNTDGNIGEEKNEITTITEKDFVIYNVDIKNLNGGIATDFEGFIPICKNNLGRDKYLIKSEINDSYDFKLQGPATLTGNNNFTLSYTFEDGLTYETAKTCSTWYSEETINNDDTLLWENVTMIKVTANSQIENLNETRISLNLRYGGREYLSEVGMKNIWKSSYYYSYNINDRITNGNYSTNEVSVSLSHTMNSRDITLTAAKNMKPLISGNTNNCIMGITTLKKEQNIYIDNVETYNVELKNKDYILNNLNLPGADANTNFAITAQLSNQTEKSVLSDSQNLPISIGKIEKNTELSISYKIYNANALSENTLIRYIVVTLKSDNGLTIKQKININRELAEAENPQSSIILGKNYILFDEINSNINITENSALTAQYVIDYIPNNYNEKKISFSNMLPINTKMILINATDSENMLYWYYNVLNSTNEIDLMDFIEMGKTSENTYTYPTGVDILKEKYLLILDFSKCSEVIQGETIVKMVYSGDNVSDFYSTELKFTQNSNRTFSLNAETTELNFGKNITINYETIAPSVSESNYIGRKLSLVINVPEELPNDSYIISDEMNYYLNANRQFIIPLKDVSEETGSITLNLNSKKLPLEFVSYECNCELWISATANGSTPLSGEKVSEIKITFEKEEQPNPALKIVEMDKRTLIKDDLTTPRNIIFDYKQGKNCTIELELQKKDGTTYQKITNKLNKVNDTTEHNNGIFDISAINGNNIIICNLSTETESGTYRFVLRVKDENNNKLLEIPYNFIVLDE
ncbi:MAG: hypothetical protein J6J60_01620 [Clostridia bacterium]|nr:hypothetical protein [Clostridia bacterium]